MNATVARIVEIMFQDTIVTDEVQAIKDEVMNNCQERYEDMLARGMTEDEAIAVVVDSLKGMEEVIAQYPKNRPEDNADDEEEYGEVDLVFNAGMVDSIQVLLTSDDVNVEVSSDDLVHVMYDKDEMPNLEVKLNGGVLDIHRNNGVHVKKKEEPKQSFNMEWNSFGDFMRSMKQALGNIQVNMCYGGGEEVTIALPECRKFDLDVRTTSGDVDVDHVLLNKLTVEDTNGDVNVLLIEPAMAMKIKTTSGDVDAEATVKDMTIQTVSGDVEYRGTCPQVTAITVSGDMDISGTLQDVMLKTVSGDVDMAVADDKLRKVECKSTSGDLTIHLPNSLKGQVAVDMQSVSGDKHNHFGEPVGAPVARVRVQSVSGDVRLC